LCGRDSSNLSAQSQSNVTNAKTTRIVTTTVNVWKENALVMRGILERYVNSLNPVTLYDVSG
jgi:hypothetical protein